MYVYSIVYFVIVSYKSIFSYECMYVCMYVCSGRVCVNNFTSGLLIMVFKFYVCMYVCMFVCI